MQWEVAADPRLRERAPGERGAGGERARRGGGARPRPRRPRGTRRGVRDRRRRPAGGRGRSGGRGGRHLPRGGERPPGHAPDRKSTRLNSSHMSISYAVFCLKKKNKTKFIKHKNKNKKQKKNEKHRNIR